MSTEVTTITLENYEEHSDLVKATFTFMAKTVDDTFGDFNYEFNIVNSDEPMVAYYTVGKTTHIFTMFQVEEFEDKKFDERRKALERHLVDFCVNGSIPTPSVIFLHDVQIIIVGTSQALVRIHNLNQVSQEGIE